MVIVVHSGEILNAISYMNGANAAYNNDNGVGNSILYLIDTSYRQAYDNHEFLQACANHPVVCIIIFIVVTYNLVIS